MSEIVVPDSEVVLDTPTQESGHSVSADIVPDSEVILAPDQNDPEAIANAAEQHDKEVEARHGKLAPLGAALEGAAESSTFGLSTKAETGLGISTPEEIAQRREDFPISHGAGQIAGLFVPGAPEAKLLGKAGEAASSLVRGSGLLSKIGRSAVKGAVENAMFQGGDEISKAFTDDPNQSAQTIVTDVGLSGLFGGALGAGFGAVHPLWDNSKASKFVDEMKSRFKEHLTDPGLPTRSSDTLGDFYADTNRGSESLYRGAYDETGARLPNVKDQAIEKLVPEKNPVIQDKAVTELSNSIASKLEEMKADKDTYLPKFTKALESDFSKWQEVASNPEATSSDIFKATEDLKRTLQTRSKIGIPIDNSNPAYDSINSFKKLASDLRKSLENEEVWGQAGKFQKETNQAFSEFQKPLKDFNRSFATKVGDEYKIDPDKVQTYLNQASKEKGSIKGEKLQNYLDAADKYRDAINNAHESIGIAGPFEAKSSESVIMNHKLGSGAKAADSIVKTIMEHGAGESAGAVGGALAGWPGYMIGKHVAGPILDSVMPTLIKPLLGSAAEGTAFKHALDYVAAFAKGETRINRGVANIFKAGKEVLPSHMLPSEKSRNKLDDQLKELSENQEPMTQVGGKTGHYLPNHGQALSQTAMNALNYINSQRPLEAKVSPLDKKQPIDPLTKQQFNRTLDIAQQPLVVLNHVKEGTLQPKDIEVLNNLYPDLYKKLSSKIITQITNLKSDEIIPYKTKMGMSLFLGKAMDSSMLPQSIVAAQPIPQQQPQQAQQAPKKPNQASAKAMNVVSQSAMTPNQSRIAEKSQVKV